MIILGIETSCDETAVSVATVRDEELSIAANVVSSQVALHTKWGGVVPNLAAREHLKNIIPVIGKALEKARVTAKNIDLIAVTAGPGLIPALLIGTSTAKTLSYLWKKPLIGIHHIEGHIYANFIEDKIGVSTKSQITNSKQIQKSKIKNSKPDEIKFPILCLVVSGGHTQLVLMKKHLDYEIIGETQDDAAGEAFDKVARMLGLGYPGGPAIAEAAKRVARSVKRETKNAMRSTIHAMRLPRPMINSGDFNFSFSGLKTAVLYLVKKNEKLLKDESFIDEVSHEFQQAVIDVLIHKTLAAARKYNPKTIMLAGGVSANLELRNQLNQKTGTALPHTSFFLLPASYSIDNAAMIAAAAFFRLKYKKNRDWQNNWKNLAVDANLKLI
jgi:N6-L-threonylcarbamoyladenine synthase